MITIKIISPDLSAEWQDYHRIRKEQIFDPIGITYNPNHPTINASGNYHFVLRVGIEIATVAHIEFLNQADAALRVLATDTKFQLQGHGKEMMEYLEKWLKYKDIRLLKLHSRLSAEAFYRKLGYHDCQFDDPSIQEQHINLGKNL